MASARVANTAITFTGGITMVAGAGAVSYGTATANDNLEVVAAGNISITNNSTNLMTFGAGGGTSNNVLLNGLAGQTSVITFGGTGNFDVVGLLRDNGGSLGIVKNGSGQLELDGNSANGSMSGGVVLNQGILLLKGSDTLGANSTTTFTINGGAVQATGGYRTIPSTISVVINADCTMGFGTTGGSAISYGGTINLGGGTRSIVMNNSVNFIGAVSNGGIIKAPSGSNSTTLTLSSQSNTYSGPTDIRAGILAIAGSNNLSPNSSVILHSGTTFSRHQRRIADDGLTLRWRRRRRWQHHDGPRQRRQLHHRRRQHRYDFLRLFHRHRSQ